MDSALADYNQALKLNPRLDKIWFNRGTLWKAKENLRQAEADLTQAIACNPRLTHAYAQRGLVRLLQGRAAEAQADFDRCLELDKDLKESLERLIIAERAKMSANK